MVDYKGAGKLRDRVAIGYAKEGADVVAAYLNEHEDAEETRRHVQAAGRRCLLLAGDVGDEAFCRNVVDEAMATFGRLDIVVNNAAEQHPQDSHERTGAAPQWWRGREWLVDSV